MAKSIRSVFLKAAELVARTEINWDTITCVSLRGGAPGEVLISVQVDDWRSFVRIFHEFDVKREDVHFVAHCGKTHVDFDFCGARFVSIVSIEDAEAFRASLDDETDGEKCLPHHAASEPELSTSSL